MLRVEALQFSRGDDILFEDLNCVVHPGQRVAVAGRNGAGKSTLFHLIRGLLQSDLGQITMPGDWRLGFMEQEAQVTQRPALEYVIDGHKDLRQVEADIEQAEDPLILAQLHTRHQDLGGYEAEARAGEILSGLGFSGEDFDKPFAAFSGGWRIRLNLAQALMAPCDLLMLDEPTNHLDLEAIVWLEQWLKRFEGTVLIIAHDRAFLDACTDHTLYLSSGSGRLYTGSYSSCERQRAENLAQEKATQIKLQAQAAHIQKFVDRFRAKASKAKQVQSRIKALERMQVSGQIQLDSPYSVRFLNPDKASNPLFSMRDLSLGYPGHTVIDNLNQSILPGDRIGVLGANDAGKTTLLRALVGDLAPLQGELQRGNHSEVGYFAQHQLETLHPENQALNTMQEARPDWRDQQCRDYLGGWGFSNDMTTRPIHTLSGGEKARLVLAMVAMYKPAVLMLDEPTNHLDLDMRDALALALQDYTGAVVIVSHDRDLLEKTVDAFWIVENGTVRIFQGDLDDYTSARTETRTTGTTGSGASRKNQRQVRAQQRAARKELSDEIKRLDRQMAKDTAQLGEVEARLADKETYDSLPADELDELLKSAGKLRQRILQQEEAWLQLSEQLESSEQIET